MLFLYKFLTSLSKYDKLYYKVQNKILDFQDDTAIIHNQCAFSKRLWLW